MEAEEGRCEAAEAEVEVEAEAEAEAEADTAEAVKARNLLAATLVKQQD